MSAKQIPQEYEWLRVNYDDLVETVKFIGPDGKDHLERGLTYAMRRGWKHKARVLRSRLRKLEAEARAEGVA